MPKKAEVRWLWLLLTMALGLLVMVLAVTAQTENGLNNDIKELQQDNKNLKEEIKSINETLANKPEKKSTQKPIPVVVQVPLGKSAVVRKIQATFGTDPRILALVACESGYSTTVVSPIDINGYVNVGLFQINMTHGMTIGYWQNIDTNIQKAWELSNQGTNWTPWPACKYTAKLV